MFKRRDATYQTWLWDFTEAGGLYSSMEYVQRCAADFTPLVHFFVKERLQNYKFRFYVEHFPSKLFFEIWDYTHACRIASFLIARLTNLANWGQWRTFLFDSSSFMS